MDDRRFDQLTVVLAEGTSRRVVARVVASGILATMVGGGAEESIAKRRKKKKKKSAIPPGCTPSCFSKVCGQDDGCGNRCTVQTGCESDEACVDGRCVGNVCTPACTGNHICQPNGSCTCPPGLKECDGPGYFGNCHECCIDAFPSVPDAECVGSPNGQYCQDYDGDLVFRCGCFTPQGCERFNSCQVNCGGICGECCDTSGCFVDVFGDGRIVDSGRDCVVISETTGELGCRCRPGFARCGNTDVCAAPGDPKLCGANCDNCTRFPGYVCRGNPERCCLPESGSCLVNEDCCQGLACIPQRVAPFGFVCG
jgi:hypothetical protein